MALALAAPLAGRMVRDGGRLGTASVLSSAATATVPVGMSDDLKLVTTVGNEAEAEMVTESLSEAGIRSMAQMSSTGIRLGAAADRDIYVEVKDYERALEVLNAAVPSEEELAALSQAAVHPAEPEDEDEAGKA